MNVLDNKGHIIPEQINKSTLRLIFGEPGGECELTATSIILSIRWVQSRMALGTVACRSIEKIMGVFGLASASNDPNPPKI